MAHKIAGIQGGRDENGIITITQPWWVEELSEAFTVGEAAIQVNSSSTLPELNRRFGVYDRDTITNGYQIGITYQGPDWSLNPDKTATYGFDSEFSEQPIETHHAINILLEKYGGKLKDIGGEKRLVFEKDLASTAEGSGAGGFAKGQQTGNNAETNPNFGYKSYPLYESVWTHTYVEKRFPSGFLERIGTVVDRPPGDPPTPDDRDWLIMTPDVEIFRNATGLRITDRYKMSKPGGWPPGLTQLLTV